MKRTYDFIRGLSPYPAAWTELLVNGKKSVLKVYATTKEFTTPSESVGTVLTDGKTYLKVALADGYLHLQTLQLAGKKRMEVADFLRGFHATEGLCVE